MHELIIKLALAKIRPGLHLKESNDLTITASKTGGAKIANLLHILGLEAWG